MSEERNPGRESNPLIERVDALIRRQREDSQRTVEEVPVLTEIIDPRAAGASPEAAPAEEETLAADIERVLLVRLVPELNRQIASLRSELEKELRRTVREAVTHALAVRKAKPGDH